jgi:hypothetical protein
MKNEKAFPVDEVIKSNLETNIGGIKKLPTVINHYGMDLRDYFAAKAMQALITCSENHGDIPHKMCAVDAYRYADSMMEVKSEKD